MWRGMARALSTCLVYRSRQMIADMFGEIMFLCIFGLGTQRKLRSEIDKPGRVLLSSALYLYVVCGGGASLVLQNKV